MQGIINGLGNKADMQPMRLRTICLIPYFQPLPASLEILGKLLLQHEPSAADMPHGSAEPVLFLEVAIC